MSAAYSGRKAQAFRRLVMASFPWVCVICGAPILSADDFTVEHIQPRSRGGEPYSLANAAPAHARCNYSRGNRPYRPDRKPYPPPSRKW